jgi:hypothetical protein
MPGPYCGMVNGDRQIILDCLAYIDLNPVRAGIVSTPESYRWCSLGYHVQRNNQEEFLSLDFGLAEFGVKKEQERLRHYRRFVHQKGGTEDEDQRSVATGRKTGKAKGRDDGLMRVPAQLRIYYFTKLPGYFGFPRSGEPLHIFLELLGLEDSVFTQRSGLSWIARRGTLS